MDIGGWLRGLGLEQYEQAFRENEIDLRVLPQLTADDLKNLGVATIGHRRLLLKAIADLAAGAGRAAAEDVPAASPANATADAERRQLEPSASASSDEIESKRGWLSTIVKIAGAGVVVFAIYSAVSPFFCSECFFLESVAMNDMFAKLGYDSKFVQGGIAAADEAIEANDYRKRIFDFDSDGHVGSIYHQLTTQSVGNIVFGEPKTVEHGKLEELHFFKYEIPGLGIGLEALAEIIESITSWKRRKVSKELSCTPNCGPDTWLARVQFDGAPQIIDVSGADMLRYVRERSEGMFLEQSNVTPNSVTPADFFAFVAFETKQYTDPCTRNMLRLGFSPDSISPGEWDARNLVGRYQISECNFLIGAI
jgi:hypothetical protein